MLLYQILAYNIHGKILKSHKTKKIYVNKIKNRITFRIKTG